MVEVIKDLIEIMVGILTVCTLVKALRKKSKKSKKK